MRQYGSAAGIAKDEYSVLGSPRPPVISGGPRPVSAFDLISGAVDGLARVAEHADAIASRLLGDPVPDGPQTGVLPYPPGILNGLQHDADRVQAAMARIDDALSRIERALP